MESIPMKQNCSAGEIRESLEQMGSMAKAAARKLAVAAPEDKNRWLTAMADAVDADARQSIRYGKRQSRRALPRDARPAPAG